MLSDELQKITEAHYNQLKTQGEMRDGDTINDKQLNTAQAPVLSAANAAVKLKLKQEDYRAVWDYKDMRRADKWAHRDKVKQMRRDRRELVRARKAARKAAKEERRRARKAERKKQVSEKACVASSGADDAIHENE